MSLPTSTDFDPVALRKKYNEERDKRLRLRPEGLAQFVTTTGEFGTYRKDPYVEFIEREPKNEDVDVVIIGGGFAGMLAAVRLIEKGVDNIRICERGGDFGGTWYWNRYPGAACDVESYSYLPLLEEMGYMPTAKYAKAPEILEYSRMIARKYGLYDRGYLQTRIEEARWDEATSRWIVTTDRGDRLTSKFVIIASGHYREPKLPGIPGIETFKQHSFHTSRWDYDYTGGSPDTPLDKLKDKVVGIIGTGATAIQCVPNLAKWAKHLYVFQRTPSSVEERNDHPTDPEWFRSQKPGWHQERMRNFVLVTRGMAQVDLIQDGWSKMTTLVKEMARPDMTPEEFGEIAQTANFMIMEDVRKRIDEVVKDPATAESLKPWYDWLCKRPCYHDEYLSSFNRPNVTLVDTQGMGVERISEDAAFANGQEYKLDCLIYATGFDLSPYEKGTAIPVIGRGGETMADKWKDGALTMHGIHVHGFPNFMISGTRQGSWDNNFPFSQEMVATHVAYIVSEALKREIDEVEVTAKAEADWVAYHESKGAHWMIMWRDCTPSYFNNEGTNEQSNLRDGNFGGGVFEFEEILQNWRAAGDMPAMKLTSKVKAG
jgi:cation diffusion facilitator CzcD-associated flavoprotein CzcO